jgi:hypothetical protein
LLRCFRRSLGQPPSWFLTTSTVLTPARCGLIASHYRPWGSPRFASHTIPIAEATWKMRASSRRSSPRRTSDDDSRTASLRPGAPSRLRAHIAARPFCVRPPPRGFAPSHSVSPWLWLPAAHMTLSFLGLCPLQGPFPLAASRPRPKSLP